MTTKNNDWVSWALGIASGVGLWFALKPETKRGPGVTKADEMPKVASPSRFANLDSVALRLDQVRTLYRSGRLTPIQTLAETEGLLTAANSFTTAEGEMASEVYGRISLFQAEVQDYIDMQRAGAVGNSPA